MRILFIGDIVGASGRQIVVDHLNVLKEKYQPDLIIANGENSAHGKGITYKIYNQLLNAGIQCITMGNHTFAKREILDDLDKCEHLLIPANMKGAVLGRSYKIYYIGALKVCVINLYGESFMNNCESSPFPMMDKILDHCHADIYFVDFHGESNSEKMLFAHTYSNQIQAVVGTHTHVQTADERIINKAAYITDVGMCGAKHSIIGRDVDEIYQNAVLKEKTYFKVADGDSFLNSVLITIDEDNKQAIAIERINI